jgi:hypothetical protein
VLLLLLACSLAMLRPAQSLPKGEGSLTLGAGPDPAFGAAVEGCFDTNEGSPCAAPSSVPFDVEYRLGLGRGWEIAARGLLPPRAFAVKYAVLDEPRHPTPLSFAVQAEGGIVPRIAGERVEVSPFARLDALTSGTVPVGAHVALRPAGSGGLWLEPGADGVRPGFGYTLGIFVPIRLPGGLALAPWGGAAGFVPLHGVHALSARFGLSIEPWLVGQSPPG